MFAGAAAAPWQDWAGGGDAPHPGAGQLSPITGEQLRVAANTYKDFTGLGCDAFHPRWFVWLSSELLKAFAHLLNSMERLGVLANATKRNLDCTHPQEQWRNAPDRAARTPGQPLGACAKAFRG